MKEEKSRVDARLLFYKDCIHEIIKDKNASILVIGGGENDKLVFQENGFTDVTISNIDERQIDSEYYPYKHCFQNAEKLSFVENEFDYVTAHATLHHCSSPHRALTEMYRVAKKSVVVIESRDSWLMRLLIEFNITPDFETAAIYDHNCKYGGVNNTCIPNYIYRWTEREVEKTIKSYAPFVKHKFIYRYGLDEPSATKRSKSWSKKIIINILSPIYRLVVKCFPKQQNLFAFVITKPAIPDDLQPWINIDNGVMSFNESWAAERIKAGSEKKR
jgi:ubiquinone/menaquinone biosynthesis C-methylase UbiE